uniref:DUF7789 domain-containing protein n=1 Tax=Latimeria chalumnae TaxID=7897 RepID=H3BIQ0_LATCH
PNLKPRHQDLVETPCGPIKPWSELSCLVKTYFCVAILSLLGVLAVTIWNVCQPSNKENQEDFTVALIQMIGVVFCCYYVVRGILQENRQELIVFIISVVLVMIRSVANFSVLSAKDRDYLIVARFVCILLIGLFHIVCASILIRSKNLMAFRVGGALESFQRQYFWLNLCFSMVTFDLQAQLLKEIKALVWIYALQHLPEVAYLIYLLYTYLSRTPNYSPLSFVVCQRWFLLSLSLSKVSTSWGKNNSYVLSAASVIGSVFFIGIKGVLFWALFKVYRSFGQGLQERSK